MKKNFVKPPNRVKIFAATKEIVRVLKKNFKRDLFVQEYFWVANTWIIMVGWRRRTILRNVTNKSHFTWLRVQSQLIVFFSIVIRRNTQNSWFCQKTVNNNFYLQFLQHILSIMTLYFRFNWLTKILISDFNSTLKFKWVFWFDKWKMNCKAIIQRVWVQNCVWKFLF